MFIEYRCDGIIHCIEGTDEYNCHKQYTAVKEKRFFSSEATLLCQENRTDDPTTSAPEIHKQWPMIWYSFTQIFFLFQCFNYNSILRAIPCDGFSECYDNSDENCKTTRFWMFAILGILLVIMIPTYAIMLKKIKEEQVEIPEDQFYKDNFKKEDCINFSGDDLANLKVNHSNHLSKSKYK